MRSTTTTQTKPFDQGAASVKLQDGLPNPYPNDSVEFGNYELGRAYAMQSRPIFAPEAARGQNGDTGLEHVRGPAFQRVTKERARSTRATPHLP